MNDQSPDRPDRNFRDDGLISDGGESNLVNPHATSDETIEAPVADAQTQRLTAYLDGELTDQETAQFETELMNDPSLRSRLHDLQATWDLLDQLPRSQPNDAFLKSTIEMVVKKSTNRKTNWHRWPIRIFVLVSAFCFSGWGAAKAINWYQGAPFRQFVTDLDLSENFERYDQVQDVEFLERLRDRSIFHHSGDVAAQPDLTEVTDSGRLVASETRYQMNLNRLQSMDAASIHQLKTKASKFDELSAEKKDRFREMHHAISAHPDREALIKTMLAYCAWFALAEDSGKYELRSLPVDERVDAVVRIRDMEAEARFGLHGETSLPAQDIPALFRWCSDFCDENRKEMIELFVDNWLQRQAERAESSSQTTVADRNKAKSQLESRSSDRIFLLLRSVFPKQAAELIDTDDVQQLESVLSDEAKATLADVSPDATDQEKFLEQRKLVNRWLTSALEARNSRKVDEEDFLDFLETELTDEQRKRLESMPRERRRDFALRAYREKRDLEASEEDKLFQFSRPGRNRNRGQRNRQTDQNRGPR